METTRLGIILGMGFVTYLIRVLPQLLFVGRSFPATVDRYLRYLSYALIAAIVSTSLFLSGAHFEAAAAPRRALALLGTVLVALWSRSPLLGMLAGTLLAMLLPWLL